MKISATICEFIECLLSLGDCYLLGVSDSSFSSSSSSNNRFYFSNSFRFIEHVRECIEFTIWPLFTCTHHLLYYPSSTKVGHLLKLVNLHR